MSARRFFDFQGQQLPIRRDEATELYLDTQPPRLLAMFTGNGGWVVPGATFTTNRLGKLEYFEVVLVEHEIEIHSKRARWAQLRRRALVVPAATPAQIEAQIAERARRKE